MNSCKIFLRPLLLLLPLLSVACSDDLSGLRRAPGVEALGATAVTRTEATLNGSLLNAEGCTIRACGFLYSTSPSMADCQTLSLPSPVSDGDFSLKLENLEAGRKYYYCTYASSGYSTARSTVCEFTTALKGTPVFSDVQVSLSGVSSADVSAQLLDDGGSSLSMCGFLYKEYAGQDGDETLSFGGNGVTFISSPDLKITLTDLQPGKSYMVCAMGLSGSHFGYSPTAVIVIPATELPVLSAVAFSDTTNSSVHVSARLLSPGSSDIVERGFCYSLEKSEPTVVGHVVRDNNTGANLRAVLSNLQAGETYYVRAFAKNAGGYAYGPVSTLTIMNGLVVKTGDATDVTAASATVAGAIAFNNTGAVKSVGFCWSADNSLPTITDNNAVVSSSADGFSYTLSSLRPETTYYYRAFAESARGIAYGEVRTFTTLSGAAGTVAAMVGTWNCREEHTDRLGQIYYKDYTVTFNSDGTFTSSALDYISSSWSVSGTDLRANAFTIASRDVNSGQDFQCTLDDAAYPTRLTGTVRDWVINSNTLGSTNNVYEVVLTRNSH